MAVWTTIPDGDIDPDSPVTTPLMTALRDNVTALSEGVTGAPKILLAAMDANSVDASKIVASAVHTSELNTATGSTSTTAVGLHVTMTGGMYVFAPQLRKSNTNAGNAYIYGTSGGSNVVVTSTTYLTQMTIGASVATFSAQVQYRYVAASPPHDMGDGDIPSFIYAVIDNTTGDVESISESLEPVWLHNGITNAMPDFWRNGKKFKIAKEIPDSFASLSDIERKIAISELPDVEVEITNDMVHADMDLIPHPFTENDLTDKTIVMLDPVSPVVRQLAEINRSGEDIHSIIRDKYIKIGNTGLNRVTPQGLLIPETVWKKTA